MFAEGFAAVQVINTVLSYDEDASAPMAAMFGSSLALSISDIPFNGPIAGVQVAYIDGDHHQPIRRAREIYCGLTVLVQRSYQHG